MRIKKYLPIIISGGIALVLLVIASVFLFRYYGQYKEVKNNLSSAESRLNSLIRREPFPSVRNVEIEQENLSELQEQVSGIKSWMKKGQPDLQEWTSPTEFQTKLDNQLQDLQSMAEDKGVDLPSDFHFGFSKYAEGEMPERENVKRLSRQLQMIDSVCRILFSDKIEELEDVGRQKFDGKKNRSESAGETRGLSRRGGSRSRSEDGGSKEDAEQEDRDEQDMYAWEEFTFEFKAKEGDFWDVMDDFANTNLLVSVEKLDIESIDQASGQVDVGREYSSERGSASRGETSGFSATGDRRGFLEEEEELQDSGEEDGEQKQEYPPRKERIAAGRGLLNVRMTVDMYRFLEDENEEKEMVE